MLGMKFALELVFTIHPLYLHLTINDTSHWPGQADVRVKLQCSLSKLQVAKITLAAAGHSENLNHIRKCWINLYPLTIYKSLKINHSSCMMVVRANMISINIAAICMLGFSNAAHFIHFNYVQQTSAHFTTAICFAHSWCAAHSNFRALSEVLFGL